MDKTTRTWVTCERYKILWLDRQEKPSWLGMNLPIRWEAYASLLSCVVHVCVLSWRSLLVPQNGLYWYNSINVCCYERKFIDLLKSVLALAGLIILFHGWILTSFKEVLLYAGGKDGSSCLHIVSCESKAVRVRQLPDYGQLPAKCMKQSLKDSREKQMYCLQKRCQSGSH